MFPRHNPLPRTLSRARHHHLMQLSLARMSLPAIVCTRTRWETCACPDDIDFWLPREGES